MVEAWLVFFMLLGVVGTTEVNLNVYERYYEWWTNVDIMDEGYARERAPWWGEKPKPPTIQ